jgi:predicted small metal-binding protein
MRKVTCACGYSFTAADDEELFRLARAHADQAHPEMRMTDEQIRALCAAAAREPA